MASLEVRRLRMKEERRMRPIFFHYLRLGCPGWFAPLRFRSKDRHNTDRPPSRQAKKKRKRKGRDGDRPIGWKQKRGQEVQVVWRNQEKDVGQTTNTATQTRVLVNLVSKSHLEIVLFSFLVSHHAAQTLKLNEMFSSTVCFPLPKTLWCLSFNGLETSVCSVVVEYYSCSFQKFKKSKLEFMTHHFPWFRYKTTFGQIGKNCLRIRPLSALPWQKLTGISRIHYTTVCHWLERITALWPTNLYFPLFQKAPLFMFMFSGS